jgi:hypothetical protein
MLILKRASASRSSGEWSDDDYDVPEDGLERSRRANWKHGYYSREAKAEHYSDLRHLIDFIPTSHSDKAVLLPCPRRRRRRRRVRGVSLSLSWPALALLAIKKYVGKLAVAFLDFDLTFERHCGQLRSHAVEVQRFIGSLIIWQPDCKPLHAFTEAARDRLEKEVEAICRIVPA